MRNRKRYIENMEEERTINNQPVYLLPLYEILGRGEQCRQTDGIQQGRLRVLREVKNNPDWLLGHRRAR